MKFKTWLASIILGVNIRELFEELDDHIGCAIGGIENAKEAQYHEDMMYQIDRVNRRYLEPAYIKVGAVLDVID